MLIQPIPAVEPVAGVARAIRSDGTGITGTTGPTDSNRFGRTSDKPFRIIETISIRLSGRGTDVCNHTGQGSAEWAGPALKLSGPADCIVVWDLDAENLQGALAVLNSERCGGAWELRRIASFLPNARSAWSQRISRIRNLSNLETDRRSPACLRNRSPSRAQRVRWIPPDQLGASESRLRSAR